MDAADLFRSSLGLIERVARGVCQRARVYGPDADDFVSAARLALMEDDYAILRKHAGRASLSTYLTVVFERLLVDTRTRVTGRWHPSREAERMGPAGVMLETLMRRDQRSLDEALPHVQTIDATLTRADVEAMVRRLPERSPRPHAVPIESVMREELISSECADMQAILSEAHGVSELTCRVIRETLRSLPLEDRMIIRFHYGRGMSIADIARVLRLPQRPLYRRLDTLLQRFRNELRAAGVDGSSIVDLIGAAMLEMDFGLAPEKGVDSSV